MKQFNLDEYLKNPQKKVITREGLSVRIICTDKVCDNKGSQKPIIALVNFGNKEIVYPYSSEGISSPLLPKFDLFFTPEKKEGWINIYKINSIICPGPQAYNTKEEAESARGGSLMNYVSTIKIQWEE
mgnify:CR=1 FL=1